MADGQHSSNGLDGPASDLLTAARNAVPRWLARCVERVAVAQSIPVDGVTAELDAMVARRAGEVPDRPGVLPVTDVDEQRANQLDSLRDALVGPA